MYGQAKYLKLLGGVIKCIMEHITFGFNTRRAFTEQTTLITHTFHNQRVLHVPSCSIIFEHRPFGMAGSSEIRQHKE